MHNIQLVLVHLPCKVTFIICAMKQLNYSVLSSLPFSFPYFLCIWCNVSFYQRKNYLLYVCVLVTQLCQTLFHHMACIPPGSSVHGILQARIREWVAISFSKSHEPPWKPIMSWGLIHLVYCSGGGKPGWRKAEDRA